MNGKWSPLEKLLEADLLYMAAKLSPSSEEGPTELVSIAEISSALRLAERLSRRAESAEDRRRCVLLSSLIWEHHNREWYAVAPALIQILSRLELGPVIRMLDPSANGAFQSLGSLFSELSVAAYSLPNEVTLASGRRVLLSAFQKQVWDAMSTRQRVGVSAPTSAGKSFVIVQKIVSGLCEERGDALVVVPTISLIQQMTRDLVNAFRDVNAVDAVVTQTYSPKYTEAHSRTVYVLTQERTAAALAHSEAFTGLRYFVVDEIQNVERVAGEDDDRSRVLIDVIDEIVGNRAPAQVTLSGPRIEGIERLADKVIGSGSFGVTENTPPVVNITYALRKTRSNGVEIRQYAETLENAAVAEWKNPPSFVVRTFGRQQYGEQEHQLIAWVTRAVADDGGVLVFSPTPNQACSSAEALADRWERQGSAPARELAEYAAETVHRHYGLVTTSPKGIGFHHGKMPHHLRVSTEAAFRLQLLPVLFCTTTLMQGVNLPAKTIIARNPKLFVRRSSSGDAATLSGYEFANLRGRAGRLLQDFVGRAIILDETEFDNEELDLFDYPQKEIDYGYEGRFERHRREIGEALLGEAAPQAEAGFNDLVTYIRHAVLRFGSSAGERLRAKGISLSAGEIDEVLKGISLLEAPRDFLLSFRYWDPLELDKIFKAHTKQIFPAIPQSPFALDFQASLRRAIETLTEVTPYYGTKHLKGLENAHLTSVLAMAEGWAKEESLKDIIDWGPRFPITDSREVNRRVGRIQKHVMYDIPKALAPVVWLQDPENPLLTFMEMGGYSEVTRRLVELGVPRETALRVRELAGAGAAAPRSDSDISRMVKETWPGLNRWERYQVEESLVEVSVDELT